MECNLHDDRKGGPTTKVVSLLQKFNYKISLCTSPRSGKWQSNLISEIFTLMFSFLNSERDDNCSKFTWNPIKWKSRERTKSRPVMTWPCSNVLRNDAMNFNHFPPTPSRLPLKLFISPRTHYREIYDTKQLEWVSIAKDTKKTASEIFQYIATRAIN